MFCIFFNIWILVNCYHLTNHHKIIFKIYNTYIFTISLTSFIIVSYEYILTNYMHYYFYSLSLFLYIYISFYVIRKRLSNKIFRILSWSTVPYKRSLEKLFSKLTPAYLSFHSFQQTFIHTPSILLFSPFLSLLCIIHATNFYQILHFPSSSSSLYQSTTYFRIYFRYVRINRNPTVFFFFFFPSEKLRAWKGEAKVGSQPTS